MSKKLCLVMALVMPMLAIGCSQQSGGWTEEQIRVFIPQTTSICEVLTQQALMDKDDNVRKAVNIVAKGVGTSLAGQYSVDAEGVDFVVEQAAVAAANAGVTVPAIAKPIIKSILLVGLQSAQNQINQTGLTIAQKNQLIVDFVKAAALGVQNGSATDTPVAGQFVLPLDSPKKSSAAWVCPMHGNKECPKDCPVMQVSSLKEESVGL